MQSDSSTVTSHTHLADVAKIMVSGGNHHLPVVDDGVPVGMISRHDLLALFANSD